MLKRLFSKRDTSASIRTDAIPSALPRHVAIIMDGNGRWAKGQGLLRTAGHAQGVEVLHDIVQTASDIGLEVLTVYAFSTENWKRPAVEVDFLMQLFSTYLDKELQGMHENNVRIRFIGRMDELSPLLQEKTANAEALMRENTGLRFNIAVNYGSQDELLRTVRKLAAEVKAGAILPEDITAETMEEHLDTAGLPPVDLVIRTSGDQRMSNFLLWQAAYAEFYFTEKNWPDFTPEDFVEALQVFAGRDRRFGGLPRS
ncbi:isoprenyl transferase [Selenomonas sp. TAMA-11512]|uniref:isoprenyl transferase n=1 Tax=Selenomonas sp. TAMA-11512 TaxID=3095337 RepID=UPI0030D3A2AA